MATSSRTASAKGTSGVPEVQNRQVRFAPFGATNKTPVRKKPSDASPKTLGPQQHLEFQEQLLRKEAQIADLERVVQEKFSIIERLKTEVAKRRESEEQMKQVQKKNFSS